MISLLKIYFKYKILRYGPLSTTIYAQWKNDG